LPQMIPTLNVSDGSRFGNSSKSRAGVNSSIVYGEG
jgi:hypothetical protein